MLDRPKPDSSRRVLVATLSPESGGVPAMLGFVTDCLQQQGWDPVLAHYEPYSVSPRLSVPSFRLSQRCVGAERRLNRGLETHAIGAWLPEIEFMNYGPNVHWRRLINSCQRHIAVSGSALAATSLAASGRPFLAWVATGWQDDRADRVRHFPWQRKVLDRVVTSPVQRALERRILRRGHILALSRYTEERLNALAGARVVRGALHMPIDFDVFRPDSGAVVPGRIGFSGRLTDPRKNIKLLLAAAQRLSARGHDIAVELVGGQPDADLEAEVARLGLSGQVQFVGYAPKEELVRRLQSFDVYVIPSHQEGLCIAGLEAMACGCPVVSTRCGGPEEYVIDGSTGQLVGFDPDEMAWVVERIITNREQRVAFSENARRLVQERYGQGRARDIFLEHFDWAFRGAQKVTA